ncbi:MAG: Bacterial regulatory protein Fis family [Candidatus Sulfotelmatobacter sp.]|nr:Bacterial regulatory protein Fis family [Candidatus Sulfotelmatobacter sp.]
MKTLAELEHDHIVDAVGECNGDWRQAAALLGIGKTTIYRKRREYRMAPVFLAAPLRKIKQPRFLLMPSTLEEKNAADLQCPHCHAKVLLPNGAHQ